MLLRKSTYSIMWTIRCTPLIPNIKTFELGLKLALVLATMAMAGLLCCFVFLFVLKYTIHSKATETTFYSGITTF